MSGKQNYFDRIAETGQLVVISGPNGVGRRTVMEEYMKTHPNARECPRVTTRSPREDEKEGEEYFFISTKEYDQMIRSQALLEHIYRGSIGYGTPKKTVELARNEGHNVFLKLDAISALMVRAHCPDATLIFIVPPTWNDLKERLAKKADVDNKNLDDMLMIAQEEVMCAGQYDYVLVNDDLGKCVRRLDQIVHGNRFSKLSMQGFLESYIESEIENTEFMDVVRKL